MNTQPHYRLLLVAVLVCLVFSSQRNASGNQNTDAGRGVSWDSANMDKIEHEYNLLWETYYTSPEKIAGDDFKTKFGHVTGIVGRLFRKRLCREDLRRLAVSCDSLPIQAEDRSKFVNDLLAFMIRTFADRGDRKLLVELLSRRCPGRIMWKTTIEAYLANHEAYSVEWYQTLEDPILILGEAYSKCATREVRHDIAAAVRRGFAGLGIHGNDDRDFVANAMQWYEQEKDQIVANEEYRDNDYYVPLEDFEEDPALYETFRDGYPRQPLFKKKLASAKRPHRDYEPTQRSRDCGARTSLGDTGNDGERENGPEMLEATWHFVEVTDNGTRIPEARVKGLRCVITKETAWLDGVKFSMRFRPGQPRAIDLINQASSSWKDVETTPLIRELLVEITPAIYELRKDCLRICHAETDAHERPTSFESKEGSGWTLIILQRSQDRLVAVAAVIAAVSLLIATTALLLWPTKGLYWRWKRRATKRT